MKVFVSGAAGFIGSRLARALLERGDAVVGFDNFDPYYSLELKHLHGRDLKSNPKFQLIEGDLRDAALLRQIFERDHFDAVAHIAAMAAVRYSVAHPLVYAEVNVQGTVNLLDAARQTSRPNCVLASTGSVYGRDMPLPFDENAPAVSPLAPYPASKRAMELFAFSFAKNYELPTTILRFFNVYGPHGRPDMMPWQWSTKIARGEPITLFDEGRMKRDWTFIDDIVRGFIFALDKRFEWEVFNLGAGKPVENRAFVRILERLLEREAVVTNAPAPSSEPPETFAKIDKAREMLGWEPQIGVDEGLRRFIEWMRAEKLL